MRETRWLDTEGVAAYISVRPDAVTRLVKQGRIPDPAYPLGPRKPRWDRLKLDSLFEGGAASTDPEQAMAAVAQQILQAGRR